MKLIDEAIKQSKDIWDECVNHPFITKLCDGGLNEESFKKYIIEDSIYLREYARCFAYAMTKSKTMEDIRIFYSVLSFVNESETSIRIKYIKEFGLTENEIEKIIPSKENQDYINFMLEISKNGNIEEILMAILPCMLSYYYIFMKKYEQNPNILNTKYADLINDYISVSYKDSCDYWINYTNELCKNSNNKEILIEIFRQSSIYELGFWNMSMDV